MIDTLQALGAAVARAVRDGDDERLEALALQAGTYDTLRRAAQAAGVDFDELEEALAAI